MSYPLTDGDRDRVITAEVVARAWKDDDYRARLIADPNAVLTEAGANIPAGVKVTVLANSPTIANVGIPSADRWEDKAEDFFAGLRQMLPLPEGVELRIVQNTENHRQLVLPLPPSMGDMSEEDLISIAGGININTALNANEGVNGNAGLNFNAGVDVSVVAVVLT